jgi:hypothetical protein
VRAAASLLLIAMTWTGCAHLQEVASPAPTPPAPRSASLPPPSIPPPAVPPPPATPTPPKPLVLSPQLDDEQGVQSQAQNSIDEAERLVRQIDRKKLVGEERQNFLTIQSFVAKAKEALSARDVQRAFTLADKARLLAEELSRRLR